MNYQAVTTDKNTVGFKLLDVLKNILISYGLTFVFLLIFAFVITYTDFPSGAVSPVVVVITLLSVMLSGILGGKKASQKGWLTGSISGLVYMLVLYLIGGMVFKDFTLGANSVLMMIGGVLCGIVGGIIGINNKKSYRR